MFVTSDSGNKDLLEFDDLTSTSTKLKSVMLSRPLTIYEMTNVICLPKRRLIIYELPGSFRQHLGEPTGIPQCSFL